MRIRARWNFWKGQRINFSSYAELMEINASRHRRSQRGTSAWRGMEDSFNAIPSGSPTSVLGRSKPICAMKIHQLSVDDALASVRSNLSGLSLSEAERRRREFGPNRVEKIAREPALWRLLKEFTRFFSVILWCAAALREVAEVGRNLL